MNYLKIYTTLCRRGLDRTRLDPKDTESHHIFPLSIYGKNNFTVLLTTREHLIVHMCLMRAFIKRYGPRHPKTAKMSMAVHKMVYRLSKKLGCRITSRHYAVARNAATLSKIGVKRPDMVGKSYFGASEERIQEGIAKMVEKKTGMQLNYPKYRKSRIQSPNTNEKISTSRKMTLEKYKLMTVGEFTQWVASQQLYMSDGRKNGNITRAILVRGEQIGKYYD
jgi:hypothetical protein